MPKPTPFSIPSLVTLGDGLRQHRIAANFTAVDVATRVGVSEKTYRELEAGKPSAKLGTLAAVMALYGIDDALMGLATPAPTSPARAISTSRRRVSLKSLDNNF